MEVNLSQLLD